MISVCMATYNGEQYIEEQLKSILMQLSNDDEVIISDDMSTDHTIQVVEKLNDSRIHIYYNKKNHGYTGNFYHALSKAKGDYIFLSDQDDVWLPNKVEMCMKYLKKYNFVYTNSTEVDGDLHVLHKSRIEQYGIRNGFWRTLIRSRYIGCCMAFDKAVLDAIFPFPTYENNYAHDLWIALIAEKYFKTYLIQEPLLLYRRHGKNTSNGGDDKDSKRNIFIKVFSRFYYLWYVCKQKKYINK